MRSALPGSVRRLSLVLVLSATADAFSLVALLWYLTVSRAGAGALGALVLVAGLPAVGSGPLIGRWLERAPARRLLAADNAARAAILLTIAGLAAGGALCLPVLFILVGLTGLLSPVTYAGSRVLLPELVSATQLVAANRLLAVGDQFPLLAGPAVAGVTASLLGGAAALTVPAAALIAAAWAARRLPAPAPGRSARPAPASLREPGPAGAPGEGRGHEAPAAPAAGRGPGRVLPGARGRGRWRTPAVQALLALTGAYFLAYGPLEPAMPLYAHRTLHAGAVGYGALWSVFGAGALLGLLAVRPLARLRPGLVNAAGAALWGLVTLPLVVISALPAALAVMFAGGLIWGPYGVIEVMTIQSVTPRSRHGTVFGVRRAIQVAATPAGAAAGGLLLARLAPQAVIGIAAGACILAGVAGLLYRPLRQLPRPPATPRSRPRQPRGLPGRATGKRDLELNSIIRGAAARRTARPARGRGADHADRLQADR